MSSLTEDEVKAEMEKMEIWGLENGKLVTRVEFENYREACFFANTVFSLAEKNFHHPEIRIEYGAVEIDLWSHDAEGLTKRDFELAKEIEEAVMDIDWK